MTNEQHKQVRDIICWQRIGCIVVKIARRCDIPMSYAFDLFYRSDTCRRFHNENSGLYLLGDNYIVDEFMLEYRRI